MPFFLSFLFLAHRQSNVPNSNNYLKSATSIPTKMTPAYARSLNFLAVRNSDWLWLLVFVLVSESIGLLRTGNITQHCNNFISIVKTNRFWNRIHLYYWTAVRVWKGSTDVTGLLLRFLFTFKWRSQSKEERIGSGSFLRHFKSNNMSKVKIVHCVEDDRQAPISHFHMSHNTPYLPPPPPPPAPKRKKIGWALFSISL